MDTISDILQYQQESIQKINNTARTIHPKLLSHLSYKDIFDDSLLDKTIIERYNNEVLPLCTEYKEQIRLKVRSYLYNFLDDISNIINPIGYNLDTGESISRVFPSILNSNFLPSFELESIWENAYAIIDHYIPTPFWLMPSYIINGQNESVNATVNNNPINYINDIKSKFRISVNLTNKEKLERAIVLKKELFDYEIYVENITADEDSRIPDLLHRAVQRHLILKELMENESVGRDGFCISTFDADGRNVSLHDCGYYFNN